MGDTTLPIDACEFEGRTDHGLRTLFIDEFPRWELDRTALATTVKDSTNPALRSAVCLGLGQIPVKQISSDDKNLFAELATKWYALPDSSTHSAVAWLMRQWEIPEPTLPDAKQMVDGRNWFVNSQGVTFVRITTPKPVDPKPLADPLEKFRQLLSKIESMPLEEQNQPKMRFARGDALYKTGQYETALADFDAVLSNPQGSWTALFSRLFALARLKRTAEADAALAELMERDDTRVEDRIYAESLVSLWLGRKEAAVARLQEVLEMELVLVEKPRGLYELAIIPALFAASESATAEEKQNWIDQALMLLERWSQDNERDRAEMRENPDFIVLHSDPRFIKLAAERPYVPEQPYWLANREVTHGEYEAFINDTSYSGEKPIDRRKFEYYGYEEASPKLDHPAQQLKLNEAVMYCNWLSWREGRTPAYRVTAGYKWQKVDGANGYRLPREVEWEYACRAGSDTSWSTGSDESLLAPYCQMLPSKEASPCGKKLPNAWGLHDMHGNVWEWCWDPYDYDARESSRWVARI